MNYAQATGGSPISSSTNVQQINITQVIKILVDLLMTFTIEEDPKIMISVTIKSFLSLLINSNEQS